ncbi:MAG TPA: DUF3221 domain-containing protein [Bacillota bacterium]
MRWLLLILAAGAVILAAVRWMDAGGPPSAPADIAGDIVAVEDQGRVLLVQTGNSTQPDYRVRITNRTDVFRRQDGGVVRAETWSPVAGQRVRIWVDGPILESFPAQAAAGAILVLD